MSADLSPRWTIKTTREVRDWLRALRQDDSDTYRSVNVAIDMLAEAGPGLGRPLVDTLTGSKIKNLKELRPRSGREVAIRYANWVAVERKRREGS
ncbi:MAG: type II toxin-antitoxin system RelE/ParE family toxin [Frankia sp.]|nr:type II toxin-antitoxin system RelE/ParE family toxin [Frankia sp.]